MSRNRKIYFFAHEFFELQRRGSSTQLGVPTGTSSFPRVSEEILDRIISRLDSAPTMDTLLYVAFRVGMEEGERLTKATVHVDIQNVFKDRVAELTAENEELKKQRECLLVEEAQHVNDKTNLKIDIGHLEDRLAALKEQNTELAAGNEELKQLAAQREARAESRKELNVQNATELLLQQDIEDLVMSERLEGKHDHRFTSLEMPRPNYSEMWTEFGEKIKDTKAPAGESVRIFTLYVPVAQARVEVSRKFDIEFLNSTQEQST